MTKRKNLYTWWRTPIKKGRKTEINKSRNVQSRILRRSVRSSRVLYKYIALVDVFRALETPQNVLSLFFFFFIFIIFHIYICIGPTGTRKRDPSSLPPSSYENTYLFLIYMSRIELEDTSAKKRSVCEIVITDSKVTINQCWAILKNIRIQLTCTRYTVWNSS